MSLPSSKPPASPFSAPSLAAEAPGAARAATIAMYAGAERILQKTGATHRKLKPRVVLVVRALHRVGGDADGVVPAEFLVTPLSPAAEQTFDRLVSSFEDHVLRQHVEGALARFKQASETLRDAERSLTGMTLTQPLVEELKLAAFFLSRFHEAVKLDPVLAQLFPPPVTLQAEGPRGQVPADGDARTRASRMLDALAPLMPTMRVAIAVIDDETERILGATLAGAPRAAELAALNVEALRPLRGYLDQARKAWEVLAEALREPAGDGPEPPFAKLTAALSLSVDALERHALLRELLRAGGSGR